VATDLEQFTVYAPPKLVKHLKMLAESDGRTLSNFVVRSLVGCVGGEITGAGHYRETLSPETRRKHPAMEGRQVDITEAIADAVKRGPVAPIRSRLR
jgi:hypothetical protein